MTPLPPMRVLNVPTWDYVSPPADVDEGYYEEITEAICAGKQINCYVSTEKRQGGNGSPERETCLTLFIDPRTGDRRYAVESWDARDRDPKWDFATKAAALEFQTGECDRLGV